MRCDCVRFELEMGHQFFYLDSNFCHLGSACGGARKCDDT